MRQKQVWRYYCDFCAACIQLRKQIGDVAFYADERLSFNFDFKAEVKSVFATVNEDRQSW